MYCRGENCTSSCSAVAAPPTGIGPGVPPRGTGMILTSGTGMIGGNGLIIGGQIPTRIVPSPKGSVIVRHIGLGIAIGKKIIVGSDPEALTMVVLLSAIFCVTIGGMGIIVTESPTEVVYGGGIQVVVTVGYGGKTSVQGKVHETVRRPSQNVDVIYSTPSLSSSSS